MPSPSQLLSRLKQAEQPQAMDSSDLASMRRTGRYKQAYDYYLNHSEVADAADPSEQDKRVGDARRAAVRAKGAPGPSGALPNPRYTAATTGGTGGYRRNLRLEEVPSKERAGLPLPGEPDSGVSEGGEWHPLDTLAYEEAMQTRHQATARGE